MIIHVDISAACKSHLPYNGAYSGKPSMGKIPGAAEKGITYPFPPNCRMCQLWLMRDGHTFVSGTVQWPSQAYSWLTLRTAPGGSFNANGRHSPCHYTKVILLWAPGRSLPFKNSHFIPKPEPIAQVRSWKAPVPLTSWHEKVTFAWKAGSSLSCVKPIETFPAFIHEEKKQGGKS